MNQEFEFFKTRMPKSRLGDYFLGCLDCSVFIDFNRSSENLISIISISFDGYGCCKLDDKTVSLNQQDSEEFITVMEQDNLNQEAISRLVKKLITVNKEQIWTDAIEEYGFID